MEIKVIYNSTQLEMAAEFIAKHNPQFFSRSTYVKERIRETISSLISDWPEHDQLSTMGFTVSVSSFQKEDLDHDDNTMRLDILVDPIIGSDFTTWKYVSYTTCTGYADDIQDVEVDGFVAHAKSSDQ